MHQTVLNTAWLCFAVSAVLPISPVTLEWNMIVLQCTMTCHTCVFSSIHMSYLFDLGTSMSSSQAPQAH